MKETLTCQSRLPRCIGTILSLVIALKGKRGRNERGRGGAPGDVHAPNAGSVAAHRQRNQDQPDSALGQGVALYRYPDRRAAEPFFDP